MSGKNDTDGQALSRTLLREEIARIVGEVESAGETLRVGHHAGMLAAAYPNADMSIGRICDELILTASKRGVPVEMYRSEDAQASQEIVRPPPEENPRSRA